MTKQKILNSVLETYFCQGVEFNYDELNRFLNDPKFPDRAEKFKTDLAEAIQNHSISPSEFKALTAIDQDSQEDVDKFLTTEIWNPLYPEK